MRNDILNKLSELRPSIAFARHPLMGGIANPHAMFEQMFTDSNRKKSKTEIYNNIRELRQGFSADLYAVPKSDYEDFKKCHKLANEGNDSYAQYCLGIFYYEGEECEQNLDLAWQYITKAAEQHQKSAMEWIADSNSQPNTPSVKTVLAECCLYGIKQPIDRDKAISMLKEIADTSGDNFARAQNILGECYEAEEKFEQAKYWYEQAGGQEYADAEFNLAFFMLQYQSDSDEAVAKAMTLLHESADTDNNMRAQYLLGYIYENGEYNQPKDELEACDYYEQSAIQNFSEAQCALGRCYQDGIGYEVDIEEAQNWLKKASNQNNPEAKLRLGIIAIEHDYNVNALDYFKEAHRQNHHLGSYFLALMYKEGANGVEQDIDKAIPLLENLADNGNDDAQKELAEIYSDREEYDKAFILYKKSANQNNAEALYQLGRLYYFGKCPSDPKDDADISAFICFRKAVSLNVDDAKTFLGLCYLEGRGTEIDYIEAVKLLKQTSNYDSQSQANLGYCYLYGFGVRQNYKKAVHLFRKAIKNEEQPIAQNNLGMCYMNGWGVEQDYNKALRLFRKAAKQDIPLAKSNLGYCYLNGFGVEQNYDKAVKMFRIAAKANISLAQNNIGICYLYGFGVEKNYDKAFHWFSIANKQNISKAQYNLGICYLYGYGTDEDHNKAFYYFSSSLKHGDDNAKYYLGICYLNGYGVEEDDIEAIKWFWESEEQGDIDGINSLGECYYNGWGVDVDYKKAVELFQQAI
ncbi:MAG: SEL1-like repeat protein, partial [Spirochaetales bacterium]|nr:SEL1-like repeat protein [Spirochaetales bacterium]